MGEKWPPSSFQERDDGYGYEVFPFFSHLVPFGPTLIEAFACKKKKKNGQRFRLVICSRPFFLRVDLS